MKKIIENFYEYLWNPQKKYNLLQIISISEKENLIPEQRHFFRVIVEDSENDSSSN